MIKQDFKTLVDSYRTKVSLQTKLIDLSVVVFLLILILNLIYGILTKWVLFYSPAVSIFTSALIIINLGVLRSSSTTLVTLALHVISCFVFLYLDVFTKYKYDLE